MDHERRSPSRSPNVQRSTSFAGARLHFKYTGNEKKIKSSRPDNSHSEMTSRLPRQSTIDNSYSYPSLPAQGTESPSQTLYDQLNPTKSRSKTESSVSYERSPTTSSSRHVPNYYEQISKSNSSSQQQQSSLPQMSSFPNKGVSVATSSRHASAPFTESPAATFTTPSKSQSQMNYGNTSQLYPAYKPPVFQPQKSPRVPSHTFLTPESSNQYSYSKKSPSSPTPSPRPHSNTYLATRPSYNTTDISPRASATHLPAIHQMSNSTTTNRHVPSHQSANVPERTSSIRPIHETTRTSAGISTGQPPPLVRQSSASSHRPTPQSLYSQFAVSAPQSKQRHLTIGFTPDHRRDIEEAQRRFKLENEQREAALRARMEEERIAREAANKAAEKASKAAEKAAEEAKKAAEQAAEEARRRGSGGENDGEVERFIQNLEQRIQESQNSKNLLGALVGRQISPNAANNVENPTDAVKNETAETLEIVDGDDKIDRETTQTLADSSEEYTFLEKIKNMKTDQNANRRKFAEHYYDFNDDDDDSELNSSDSINSFLSTVTEEDADCASLNQQFSCIDHQTETLPTSVINYIHNLVDGIFSVFEKSDTTSDTQQHFADDKYYTTDSDSNYNYQIISDNAKQFFTPRTSAECEGEVTEN